MFDIFRQFLKVLDHASEQDDSQVALTIIHSMFLSFTTLMALLLVLAL